MTRNEMWNLLVWTIAIGTAALFVAFAVFGAQGCIPQDAAEYAKSGPACEMKMAEAVFASATCTEAQLRVDVVLRTEPACITLDAGPYDVCAKYRERTQKDGGTDGHD